jgi:putative transcriptional regulator
VEANERHTWGLVLNRVRAPRDEALPPGVARWGGPVHPARSRTLVRAAVAPDGARRVLDGLSWLEGAPPAGLPTDATLTFAGLAGWAPGQLEQEIAHGGWWVLEGSVETVFSAPESLWPECVARHL